MSTEDLHSGGLYILLFLRQSPPILNDYHWAFYVHHDSKHGGTKYHIRNQGFGWMADHNTVSGVLKSFLLVGLFQIGHVPAGLETYVDQQARTYDSQLNDISGTTCRTWLFSILEILKKPVDKHRIINSDDLKELENEINEWGNMHAASADRNVQPRPIGYSRILGVKE